MNPPSDNYESCQRRLTALEEMSMHLEQLVGQLNAALISQQRQIESLELRIARWSEKVRTSSVSNDEDPLTP